MKIDVLTLFPAMFEAVLGDSVIGRAAEKGLLHLQYINIRDFSEDKHRRVDDYPYGAGGGMVMAPQPIFSAWEHITKPLSYRPHVIYMSPQGKVFTQEKAKSLAADHDHLIFLCGHYEGVDERIIEEIVDEEISIGDYVLTGGEIPAMTVIDAVARMIPGVVQHGNSDTESLSDGLLEYPQYTRPPEFRGRRVPEILLSGHHANITKWREEQALERTKRKRPDLLK